MVHQAENVDENTNNLLSGLRALDLTDEKGIMAGRILSDLGVEVIAVEEPGGSSCRKIPPYFRDIEDPEKSLFWFSYALNKKSITLDIQTVEGREVFKNLVKRADFLLESFDPGFMDGLGLGYEVLNKLSPHLVMVSITAFGQTGPYCNYRTSDLVSFGMGGHLYLCGDTDRPPVQIGVPQAYLLAGAQAAMGALIAYHYQRKTGVGQHVDISIQESVQQTLLNAPLFWENERLILKREGPFRTGLTIQGANRQVWACLDGYVVFVVYGARMGAHTNKELVRWMAEEGAVPDYLLRMDWDHLDMGKIDQAEIQSIQEPIEKFFEKHTKKELLEGAAERGMILDPAADIKDVTEGLQLKSRDFWIQVDHEELNMAITYPGTFAKFSEGNCGISRRAPLVGEHNKEIYEKELALSETQIISLKQAGAI